MKKTVLIDARMYGLEHSGIGRYLIGLINELKRLQTNFNFVVLLRKNYFNNLVFPGNWTKVLADFGHYGFTEQISLPGIIKRFSPDLVHFPHINTPLLYNGKFVITVHDLTIQKQKANASSLPIPLYYFKRLSFLLIVNWSINRAGKIITPTKSVEQELSTFYKISRSKIKTIYEGFDRKEARGVDNNLMSNKYGIDSSYFVYVGNAYPHKNLETAIEAISDLNKKIDKKVYLVIGGSRNIFTRRLNRMIVKNKATEYVKLIGFVEDKDLITLYKNSLGFLYPSLSEGFGLQGLEAINAGTLLLCSNISVFKEVYGEYGFYFNPRDVSSISATMKYVYELSSDKRVKLINASQKFIRKYSWKKMAKETLNIYESCIGI